MNGCVTCRNCGWVHMAISRADAEADIASFNAFFNTLAAQQQARDGGHSKIASGVTNATGIVAPRCPAICRTA